MSQSELVLVEAIATSTEATRELWRFIFGIDLIALTLWNYDPATPLFLMVNDARRLQLQACRRHLAATRGRRRGSAAAVVRRRRLGRARGDGRVLSLERRPLARGRDAGPTEDAAELALSAADLASAYLGAFSFERLAAAGRVRGAADGAIARATALFRTPLPPCCPEPF